MFGPATFIPASARPLSLAPLLPVPSPLSLPLAPVPSPRPCRRSLTGLINSGDHFCEGLFAPPIEASRNTRIDGARKPGPLKKRPPLRDIRRSFRFRVAVAEKRMGTRFRETPAPASLASIKLERVFLSSTERGFEGCRDREAIERFERSGTVSDVRRYAEESRVSGNARRKTGGPRMSDEIDRR